MSNKKLLDKYGMSDLKIFVDAVEQNNDENGGSWSEWDNAKHIAEAYDLKNHLHGR